MFAYGYTVDEVLQNPEVGDKVRDLFAAALTGCAPGACNTHRVLVLIRDGGSALLARLDEGGFAHDYGYGSECVTRNTAPLIVDSGLRALRRGGSPYPGVSS